MPPTLDDGWEVAAPSEVGLDAAGLSGLGAFLRQWPAHNIHAVVVIRRGRLAFEQYFRGRERRWMDWSGAVQFSPTQKHDIRSISKSVTSLLVGAAVWLALLKKANASRLRKGLPAGVEAADKPGELEGVRVDAGIVYAKNRPYILCVMTTYLKSEAEGELAIEEMSRASYDYFSRLGAGLQYGRQVGK